LNRFPGPRDEQLDRSISIPFEFAGAPKALYAECPKSPTKPNPRNKPQTKEKKMAILRSNDGRFYEIADEQLEDAMIPADEVKERLGAAGVGPASGPVGSGPDMVVPGTGGQVVIQIYPGGGAPGAESAPSEEEVGGDVEAHGWCWRRNYFRNYWRRNCWRNHCWRNHCR